VGRFLRHSVLVPRCWRLGDRKDFWSNRFC